MTDITPPLWSLHLSGDRSEVDLLWVQGSRAENFTLGLKEDVMERLAGFLAEHDFGE
jgi:hypothetical protein